MGCDCGRFARFWLLVQNLALFVCAVALLTVSVDALVEGESRVAGLLGAPVSRGTALLLASAAALVLLLSFLGCCGAMTSSRCVVGIFGCLSVILLALSLAGFASAFFVTGPGAEKARESMLQSMARYDNDTEVAQVWDFLQRDFHCCGVDSGADWERNGTHLVSNATVPASCCKPDPNGNGTYLHCENNPTGQNSYTNSGCFASARDLVKDHTAEFAGAAAAVAVFLILSTVLSCCFVRKYHQETYERLTV